MYPPFLQIQIVLNSVFLPQVYELVYRVRLHFNYT